MFIVLMEITPEQLKELHEKRVKGETTSFENKVLAYCYSLEKDDPLVKRLEGYAY